MRFNVLLSAIFLPIMPGAIQIVFLSLFIVCYDLISDALRRAGDYFCITVVFQLEEMFQGQFQKIRVMMTQ